MAIFTVHLPQADSAERLLKAVFVKDGFRWWAFIFGPFWLLAKKLWLAFMVYVALSGALTWSFSHFGVNPLGGSLVSLLLALVLGCEASNLLRAKLVRKGFVEANVVQGTKQDDAERRYYAAMLGPVEAPKGDFPTAYRSSVPSVPVSSGGSANPAPENPVIGMFPEPGGRT